MGSFTIDSSLGFGLAVLGFLIVKARILTTCSEITLAKNCLLLQFYMSFILQMPVVWNLPKRRLPAHDIFVDQCTIYSNFTSNANRWAPGRMFSSIKYEHFIQVSSNQKHIFIMWFDVRCGQESISKQPYFIFPAVMVFLPAVMYAFRQVRK